MDEETRDAVTMRDDEPNAPMIVLVGIVSAILLFVIIVLLQALFYWMDARERERKVVAAPAEELATTRSQQLELLSSYGWVDERGGVVRIPIDRAMELLAAEGRSGPTGPPVGQATAAGAAPAAAQAGAAAAPGAPPTPARR